VNYVNLIFNCVTYADGKSRIFVGRKFFPNLKSKNMSKYKGAKNKKKAPADKSAGKTKTSSAYQDESKNKQPALEVFTPKPDPKTGGKRKS
jgi:hypothetical protein